jgi:hypothetical protein
MVSLSFFRLMLASLLGSLLMLCGCSDIASLGIAFSLNPLALTIQVRGPTAYSGTPADLHAVQVLPVPQSGPTPAVPATVPAAEPAAPAAEPQLIAPPLSLTPYPPPA